MICFNLYVLRNKNKFCSRKVGIRFWKFWRFPKFEPKYSFQVYSGQNRAKRQRKTCMHAMIKIHYSSKDLKPHPIVTCVKLRWGDYYVRGIWQAGMQSSSNNSGKRERNVSVLVFFDPKRTKLSPKRAMSYTIDTSASQAKFCYTSCPSIDDWTQYNWQHSGKEKQKTPKTAPLPNVLYTRENCDTEST